MNPQFHAIDLIRRKLVLVAELNAAVNCRMHDNTTGEWLVRVIRYLKRLSQVFGDVAVIMSCTDRVDPAVFCLEALFGAGVVLGGQYRRRQAVLSRPSRMKSLGHRTEHFLKTD